MAAPMRRSWSASLESMDESGKASFKADWIDLEVRLNSFAEFQALSAALDAAYQQGVTNGVAGVKAKIQRALGDQS